MKIAVASCGLGHVARGIETWALDTADALAASGVDVTLFSGAELPPRRDSDPDTSADHKEGIESISWRADLRVGLSTRAEDGRDGARPSIGISEAAFCALPCLRRTGQTARLLSRLAPPQVWRWGLKNPYGWEQLSFWRRLRPLLARGGYDILHVQDPMLAYWCRRARQGGALATREILAHGTEEPAGFLSGFNHVQHLAPWHLEETLRALRLTRDDRPGWDAIPNFVDTAVYRPATGADERAAARRRFGIPDESLVVGCVAAVKSSHKRIDYLIREFGAWLKSAGPGVGGAWLAIAGSRTPESDSLRAMADRETGGRVTVLTDLARADMPDFYRSMDVFSLASLFEMMPIALLEALSSGLPVIVNNHPVLAWMAGEGGIRIQMAEDGALAAALSALSRSWISNASTAARVRAVAEFSREAVVRKYVEYYGKVLGA